MADTVEELFPELADRITALKEFCDRHDWEVHFGTASQREPEYLVAIRYKHGQLLRAASTDSLIVCVARIEQQLAMLGRANTDAYLHDKHKEWGQV